MSSSNTTKWWWKKKPSNTVETVVVKNEITEADENASIFSLYSYTESLLAPSSIYRASSSLCAQHAGSECSVDYSDVESSASIRSKPWTSRVIEIQDNVSSYSEPSSHNLTSMSMEVLSPSEPIIPSSAKRRSSLVDFFVSKGKIKAGFGRLVGNNSKVSQQIEQEVSSTVSRRNSVG